MAYGHDATLRPPGTEFWTELCPRFWGEIWKSVHKHVAANAVSAVHSTTDLTINMVT
jgi:hypothetical protein